MQTATNPQTGEKVQWNGSAWVPLQPAPQAGIPELVVPPQPKPEDPIKPNLPTGYRMKPDGSAELIPGIPPAATKQGDDDVKLQQKRASLQSLEQQINRVEELYRGGLKDEALGIISSLGEFLPTETNRQFDTAAAGMAEQGLSAFRVPGVGAQSDAELRQFVQANRPAASDFDATIEEKLRQLRVRVDATRSEMGLPPAQWLGQEPAPVDAPATPGAVNQSTNLGEVSAPPSETLVRSTNGFETVDNPALAGVRGEYLRRLGSGQGAGEIIPWLRSVGVTDPLVMRSALEQIKFRRANPNVPIENYDTNALDDMDVPLSGFEQSMNEAAGTPLGTYGMRAGQALSMNTLDNMAPNPERARIGLEDAGRQNPGAAMAGDISGSVMGALGGEAALAARGVGGGFGRAMVADTAFGAGSGAGMADDGNRMGGAVTGAAAAGLGSFGGQALMRGAGSIVSPSGGSLSDLYASGVRPTPGQRLANAGDGRGLAGLVGRAVNATEEGLSSVPVVGAAIRGARQDARDQFQIGAFNESLKEIGAKLPKGMKPGTAPHSFTQKAFDKAYDEARSGMRLAPDNELAAEVTELSADLGNLAEPSRRRFEAIVQNTIIRRVNSDLLEGGAYKKIQSELGKTIRGIRKSQSGDGELADKLEDLQGILDRAARRHSDPKAVARLDAADRGYAKLVRIEEAAKTVGGDAGTFSPAQFNRSIQRNASGVRSREFLRGDSLMQDYADQGMSLVDRMPNSGTADRAMVGLGAAGAAGYLEPNTLGLLGIIGALYAPGVRKGVAGSMAPRGPKAKAIADQIRKRGRIAGAAGAGLLLSGQKDGDQ